VAWNRELGVDLYIAHLGPFCPRKDVADGGFSPHEEAVLLGLRCQERPQASYRCGTRKEAYGKAQRVTLCCPSEGHGLELAVAVLRLGPGLRSGDPNERGKGAEMSSEKPPVEESCKVVVNHEGQYSLWPADRPNPLGWSDAGKSGSREECLAHIADVWTDMRPLSLRNKVG
jgi:MbtH protein